MLVVLLVLGSVAVNGFDNVTTDDQLILFKKKSSGPIGTLTTSFGAPIERDDVTTLNSNLIFNEYFMDSITRFDRERIPERVVHAKGAGAFGHFEVTHDVTHICNAKLFNAVGKKTPVAVRFSSLYVERGGSDTTREARGFSIKFYTEDGNLDLLTLNNELFAMKDPIYFVPYIRAFKRNPQTNMMPDPNMIWDYVTLRPESMYAFLLTLGDRGIPDGYRYMPGYAIHPFQVYNDQGNISFVKFHFNPDAGERTLTTSQGIQIAGEDLDYATRDLYTAIANEDFPTWTLSLQVVSMEDVKTAKFDLFDITRMWPENEYPLTPVGRLILNQNPSNYFAEIEQLAFAPSNLVPGILGGVDKVFEARRLSYRDTQLYRLGANFNNIEVNCPLRAKSFTFNRDGRPPVKGNGLDGPNYYPNSFNGAVAYSDEKRPELINVYTDPTTNNFDQASIMYGQMSKGERGRLVQNILAILRRADKFFQDKAIKLFADVDTDLSDRVLQGLSINEQNRNC